jgi:hypothetical protein
LAKKASHVFPWLEKSFQVELSKDFRPFFSESFRRTLRTSSTKIYGLLNGTEDWFAGAMKGGHRHLRTSRRECLNIKNGRFPSYIKQGKLKVGVVPADGLGHLCRYILPKIIFFVFIERGSLAVSAGSNRMNFRPIWFSF